VTISKLWAAAVVVALSAGPARADKTASLVKTFFEHKEEPAKIAPLLRDDAILVVDDTIARGATANDAVTYMMWFTTRSVGPIAVQSSGTTSWFQGTVEGQSFDQSGDACEYQKQCTPFPLHFHIAGAAIDGKLAVVIVTRTLSDRGLIAGSKANAVTAAPATPSIEGDKDLAAIGKLAANIAPNAFASGTAPDELGKAAAAGKLAAKWDKLALAPVAIEATKVGNLGFVYADMRWPYKPDVPVQLRLAAIAVRDHDAWKWIVIDFAS
jgi:hypothetical protein